MEEENPMIVKELKIAVHGRNTSSQSDEITTKECLQTYSKISYQMRKLKNKGAILVLVWSFMVICVSNYLANNLPILYHDIISSYSVTTIIGVTLPIAGWLADVQFGRYKIIHCSIWIMWISYVLLTTVYVVFSLTEFDHSGLAQKTLTILLVVILAFGVGGFQANII